jgi:hypothetical protein
VDPALPIEDRELALNTSYGFRCKCALCTFQRSVAIPVPAADDTASRELLFRFTGCDISQPPVVHDIPRDFATIPPSLLPYLHPDSLPAIAEMFSEASHAGFASRALELGRRLLAIYLLIYPPNYPQIGEIYYIYGICNSNSS